MTALATGGGSTTGRRGPSGREIRRQVVAFTFLVPALALMAVFLFYPIGYIIWLGFNKWNMLGSPRFVGLDNYNALFFGAFASDFLKSLFVSIVFTVLAMPAQIGLGLACAILLERELQGRAFFRSAFFFPMVISFTAAGIAFKWLFDPALGMIPAFLLQTFGLGFPNWHADGVAAMLLVVVMNTWKVAGFSMILYLAGLQGISADLYEAADIDGVASGWQRFRHISWPLLVPTTTLLVITNTIGSFQAFVPFFVMTSGGPSNDTTTIVYFIYKFFTNQAGLASAGATVFLIVVLAVTAVQLSITRRNESIY
jgi:multiple sugar transport system permease protein